jgi:DNA-binding helix-hairpin-helix protein with protein kinase domain
MSRSADAAAVQIRWRTGRPQPARLRPLGKSGGSGEVYAIEGEPGHVAKIYHAGISDEQRSAYAAKIRWMIHHPPQLPPIPADDLDIVQLAWPVGLVTRNSVFAGFVMHKVDFERTLELDYLLTRRQAAAEGFQIDYGKLVAICRNLASLIDCLHARGIAVVDLKPINIKVYKSELFVSILDCDGFQIHADGFVSAATQVTPEYLAPEFHGRAVALPQAQDAFALATIFFRLLNYGIHPYAGIAAARQAYPTELAARIPLGLYPYGRNPAAQLRPAPASVHDCLPHDIRSLFDRSLGGAAAQRATAAEWVAVLGGYADAAAGRMSRCEHGHLRFAGLPCPSCRRAGILLGHRERQQRHAARRQATPARALSYVRKTLRGTHTSPFQAALAQAQLNAVQLAPATASLRHVVSIEILWTIGLLVTYWWLR